MGRASGPPLHAPARARPRARGPRRLQGRRRAPPASSPAPAPPASEAVRAGGGRCRVAEGRGRAGGGGAREAGGASEREAVLLVYSRSLPYFKFKVSPLFHDTKLGLGWFRAHDMLRFHGGASLSLLRARPPGPWPPPPPPPAGAPRLPGRPEEPDAPRHAGRPPRVSRDAGPQPRPRPYEGEGRQSGPPRARQPSERVRNSAMAPMANAGADVATGDSLLRRAYAKDRSAIYRGRHAGPRPTRGHPAGPAG